MSGMAKPDYDGRAFYQDKGPGVKIKIRGALISNTTNVDHTVDRHKIRYPGVATYSDHHAFSKTTFTKKNPSQKFTLLVKESCHSIRFYFVIQ